jgi:hypothetical protein
MPQPFGVLGESAMTHSIQDTAAERWSRLYVDVRASYGRAAIQAALFLNGGASVALLAFLRNLAIRPPSQRRNRELCDIQSRLRLLWNRGDVGRQQQCDRLPDPERRDRPSDGW